MGRRIMQYTGGTYTTGPYQKTNTFPAQVLQGVQKFATGYSAGSQLQNGGGCDTTGFKCDSSLITCDKASQVWGSAAITQSTGSVLTPQYTAKAWLISRPCNIAVNGTFNGASVYLYVSSIHDGSNAYNDSTLQWSASSFQALNFTGVWVYAVVVSPGGSTSLYVDIMD